MCEGGAGGEKGSEELREDGREEVCRLTSGRQYQAGMPVWPANAWPDRAPHPADQPCPTALLKAVFK